MPLRVAIAGLGFGRIFAQILHDHPECAVVAVTDLHEPLAEEVAREVGDHALWGGVERSLEDVLRRPDVDAVASSRPEEPSAPDG